MKQFLWRIFFFNCLLIGSVGGLSVCRVSVAAPATTMSIDPQTSAKLPNTIFNITIVVADVSELYGWQFNITFNPTVLNYTNFYEGPFLKEAALAQDGDTYELPVTFNNIEGWVFAGRAFSTPLEHGASGSGILAYLTLKAKADGESSLHFDAPGVNTFLNTMDLDTGLPVRINFTPVDGSVLVALVHDVAVTGLEVSESRVTVGDDVSIEVTVRNEGSVPETFDVTLSYDSTVIKVEAVTELASGDTKPLNVTWNTKDLAPRDYTLTATASTVFGETETADNTSSKVVTLTAPSILPIELLLVAVIIVVVVLGVGTLLYRKRRLARKVDKPSLFLLFLNVVLRFILKWSNLDKVR